MGVLGSQCLGQGIVCCSHLSLRVYNEVPVNVDNSSLTQSLGNLHVTYNFRNEQSIGHLLAELTHRTASWGTGMLWFVLLVYSGLYYWYALVCTTGMLWFVLLVCSSLYYWYTLVCTTGMLWFVLLVCSSLYYWYTLVCTTGMLWFVLLVCSSLYYWYTLVCTTGMLWFVLLVCSGLYYWYTLVCTTSAMMLIHCSDAGVLKMYLRELPDPILTRALYNDWLKAAGYYYTVHVMYYTVHMLCPPSITLLLPFSSYSLHKDWWGARATAADVDLKGEASQTKPGEPQVRLLSSSPSLLPSLLSSSSSSSLSLSPSLSPHSLHMYN